MTKKNKINKVRLYGLFGGILVAFFIYLIFPANAGEIAAAASGKELNTSSIAVVAALAVLMGIWWMSEAVPLAVTALLPIVVFPFLGVDSLKSVIVPYASDTIFLFMGGFILALAMQKWNLHIRMALGIVLVVGTSPRKLVAGFMLATGFLSMWVSNTATAVMMLPVGLSVLLLVLKLTDKAHLSEHHDHSDHADLSDEDNPVYDEEKIEQKAKLFSSNFGISLMLGIAYSASIGSLGTLIGTPPNAILLGNMREIGVNIGFGEWMLVGVPLSIVLMGICWALLVYVLFPPEIKKIPGGKALIRAELRKIGKFSTPEKLVASIFALAAFCWVFLGIILKNYGINIAALDTAIAISVSILLFIIPANKYFEPLMDWNTAKTLPWDILLLFGGGLALSAQFSKTGLSLWIGAQASFLGVLPIIILIFALTLLIIFSTAVISNTAAAATFIPVIIGVSEGLGYTGGAALLFTMPAAFACTCSLILPVSTPPNAIAYSSGYIKMKDMVKSGLYLSVISSVLITFFILTLGAMVFDLEF